MGVTSLLSDAGHEMTTVVLPAFVTMIGAPACALATGGLAAAGIAAAFVFPFSAVFYLGVLFALNGSYMATQDALEGAITADPVRRTDRSTAYGLMASVNGAGDFAVSAVVGLLWTLVSPVVAFGYAAVLMWGGAVLLGSLRRGSPRQEIEA
jgi:hypothetical protein